MECDACGQTFQHLGESGYDPTLCAACDRIARCPVELPSEDKEGPALTKNVDYIDRFSDED